MEITCRDGLSGVSEVVEVSSETASQLLTQVCALFGWEEEDAALEVDGEVVWVGGRLAPEVPLSSLSLGDVVLRRSLERVLSMARDWEHDEMPAWAWEERSVVMEAIRTTWCAISQASDKLRSDRAVVFEACKESGHALRFAGEALRNDREFVLQVVREDEYALNFVSDALRRDPEIVREAAKASALA